MNTLSTILRRELLHRRAHVVLCKEPEPLSTPNQRHAAYAVLRAARLVSVGNWLAGKCQVRCEKLERQLAKDVISHADGFGEGSLTSLFAEYDREVTAAFDWMKGEMADDLAELKSILIHHTISAGAEHFGATGEIPKIDVSLPLVLGAPPADHLDKVAADLLFRLKAATRKAVEAGCTARQTVERLGLELTPQDDVKATTTRAWSESGEVVLAATPFTAALSAVQIGIRLFDTVDNSLAKFVQAAVTELASDADTLAADALGDSDDGPENMGFTWVSAQDVRVCEFCEYMDGGKWDENKDPVGESPELESEPPAHIGCRCALIPCDLDQPLPSGNFESYLAGFSNEEQQQAFGKSALTAYHKGEIGPGALMGQQTNELSLEKFKAMEPRLDSDSDKYFKRGLEGGKEAGRQMEAARMERVAKELGVPGA